jgi:hypothetical protein
VQASTAEKTEIYTKLLKLIELAPQRQPQCQTQSQTVPVAAATHAPITSPSAITQTPSSVPASPAPEAAPEPIPEIAPPPSASELSLLPQTASQLNPEPAPVAPVPEPISAVARCSAARNKARSDAFARSQPRYTADQEGANAFRSAMPPLLGADNIREFIACVAHGMLIGIIENKDATKLLYAAQVAFSAQTRTEPKRTPKSAAKATENN